MAKGSKPRIGRNRRDFGPDIKKVSSYILVSCPPPVGQTNGSRLKIETVEMDQIAVINSRWEVNTGKWDNKKSSRTADVIAEDKAIIKAMVDLDKSRHIYNRVASNPDATIEDYSAFNIVGGTQLASSSHKSAVAPGMKTVNIGLKESMYLAHKLKVTAPDHKGIGMEDGVKNILIYKAVALIGAVAPALNLYQYVGDVNRGTIIVKHEDTTQGMRAWYIGRVKNSIGELGEPSEPVGFIII